MSKQKERTKRQTVDHESGPVLHENVALIEVAEGWLLDALLADGRTAGHILARLSNEVAVVAPQSCDMLLARLRKLGHTPKVLAD